MIFNQFIQKMKKTVRFADMQKEFTFVDETPSSYSNESGTVDISKDMLLTAIKLTSSVISDKHVVPNPALDDEISFKRHRVTTTEKECEKKMNPASNPPNEASVYLFIIVSTMLVFSSILS
jgi:hypothetical protein